MCAALGLAPAKAQNHLPEAEKDPESEESTGFLAGTLFPDNSILKDVMLPSYDAQRNLSGTMTAEELTIVTRKEIDARNVKIELFNPDESSRGTMAMAKARFNATNKLLTSDQPVSFVSKDLNVHGSRMVFDTANSRGFLHGPVKAVSKADTRTSMNVKPARQALAAGALLMASAPALPAQEKAATSAERLAELRPTPAALEKVASEAANLRPRVMAAAGKAEQVMAESNSKSEDARITMNGFFQAAALTGLMAEPAPVTGDVPRPVIEEAPTDKKMVETTITSKDGAYIDSPEGLVVFLKDIHVQNPEFQISAQTELKLFMKPKPIDEKAKAGAGNKPEKDAEEDADSGPKEAAGTDVSPAGDVVEGDAEKPEGAKKPIDPALAEKWKAAKDAKKAAGLGGDGDSGEISRIVATGNVVVDYKPAQKGKEPIKASAHMVVYDLEKEQLILRGGSPWIIRGGGVPTYAKGADAYFVINLKDGEIQTAVTGNQEEFSMNFKVPEKDKEKEKQKTKPGNGVKPANGGKPANTDGKPQKPTNR